MFVRFPFCFGFIVLAASMVAACAPTASSPEAPEPPSAQQSESPPSPEPPAPKPPTPPPPAPPPQPAPPSVQAPSPPPAGTIPIDAASLAELQDELAAADFTVTTAEEVDASSYGVVGDGTTDNSAALRRLLAGGNRTIHVRAGDYVTGSLFVEPNTVLMLEPGVILRDSGNLGPKERLLNVRSTHHVKIVGWGARLVAERANYTTGEQRHGVLIFGSQHVMIEGLESSGHGGDGFYIGGPTGAPSTDVVLRGCKAGNNRRQGLSITSARRIYVVDCEFADTNGTAPEFGIDLEPNYPTDLLDDINFLRVETLGNRGGGIAIYLHMLDATSAPTVITIAEHRSASEAPAIRMTVGAGAQVTARYGRAN
jgi:hypothetical protein